MPAHPVEKQAAALALLAAIESCKASGYRRDDVVRVLVVNWEQPKHRHDRRPKVKVRPERGKIAAGEWWALVRGPSKLPVVFPTFRDAWANADPDEQIVKVRVTGCPGFRASRNKSAQEDTPR